jgi:methionyl-tRNA formyltransferase
LPEHSITAVLDAQRFAAVDAGNRSRQRTACLRLLLVTEDDPLYVRQFFSEFFVLCQREEFEICGVTVVSAFHEPLWKTARRMWRFYGPIDFAKLLVRFVRAKIRGDSIEGLARERAIACLPTESVNAPGYVQLVKTMAPDVIVSVAAPEIFRNGILGAAKLRCINIHSGRLPKYRGMMPTFWQLLHGEECATVTIHDMAEKLDAGAVLATLDVELRQRDSLDRVITETKRAGARLMIEVLRKIADGSVNATPLDMTAARYFKFPTSTDTRAFRAKGHRLL